MSKRYFLKELVNNTIHFANGQPVPFIHGADDTGHLELDDSDPEQAAQLKEVLEYIKRRKGGVFEVDEQRHASEKKRAPSSKLGSGVKGAPRLFEQKSDPFRSSFSPQQPAASAAPATGQESALRAAVENPAHVVTEPAKPDATTFKPRRGKRA